jgi:hypothetical protein
LIELGDTEAHGLVRWLSEEHVPLGHPDARLLEIFDGKMLPWCGGYKRLWAVPAHGERSALEPMDSGSHITLILSSSGTFVNEYAPGTFRRHRAFPLPVTG